ncbi:EAL domain-containing protein [Undibacterium sp. TS12]|uniref:putative bifunctional diguanylate cyclase/phosphodiesterase n=1 Tax=Undibacterium sp. TS12 TaxID=2908202 RepID=UPI001F4CE6F6|nr:EAL domain-containing protein [Undibacterium sp. TS12]MCH8622164.1 EAL domain-containing protein [Undibacterium sp. TS12]
MTYRILIITGDIADGTTLAETLCTAKDQHYKVDIAWQLADAIQRLQGTHMDAILVNLALPDSQGLATLNALTSAAPQIPIVTLCGNDDALAIEALRYGAQGYLFKEHYSSYLVSQSLRQILRHKVLDESAYREKARAEITLNSISDAVIGTDMAGNVDYLNVAAEHITQWTRDEARGHPISVVMPLIHSDTREPKPNPVELVLQQDKATTLTPGTILLRRNGSEVAIEDSTAPIHDSSGRIAGAVMVFHDVTATQAMAQKMAYLAQHDFLTDLPNRVLLNDRIEQAISLARRNDTQVAVLFLDLDNFKHINDSLGHATGDKLLQSVAERLSACVRHSDTVSRQGGDEFVILVTEEKSAEKAAVVADKILSSLAEPHKIAKNDLHITTSIGISLYPADGQDAGTLIKNADTAMYQAKEKGRNNYQFFKPEMNVRAVERQIIEANLRLALVRKEFVLHYQPKINLTTNDITGAEALLRWSHPEWGLVSPVRFITIAEECGVIIPIGRWVLQEACAQTRRWQDEGLKIDSISVNISAVEFRRQDFVEAVRSILNKTGLDAHCLQLEITESVLMRDAENSIAILQQLKDMGIQLAVDDFGTGYSSLSYLNQFPIDVLKIDQSFVNEIGAGKTDGDGAIVSAVIAMGNSLKQKVIAEGVENPGQLRFLKDQQCEEGQGYIFARPLAADHFAKMLRVRITAHAPIPVLMPV